jgi:hypothetical protein
VADAGVVDEDVERADLGDGGGVDQEIGRAAWREIVLIQV